MQSQSTDDNDTATLGVVVVKERISITHESHNNTLRMFVDMKLSSSSSFTALNNHDPVGAYETRTTPPTTHTPIVISTHSPTIIIAEISPPRITTILLVLMLPRSAQ